LRIGWPRFAGGVASLQLPALGVILGLALGLMTTMAWPPTDAALTVALLTATGAAVALIGLRPHDRAAPATRVEPETQPDTPSQLLAQMHHELRTPLNAMIGFSEVMLQELHGPLGNARYQEYAAHISESGERLLRASEDALAVAATMSALVADRRLLRRERLQAAALLQTAWAASGGQAQDVRLRVEDCVAVAIRCDWEASSQALQHLLGEALAHTAPGWTIAARCDWNGRESRIEIAVEAPGSARGHEPTRPNLGRADAASGNGVRVMLARSLLEMQGATLSLATEHQAKRWSARIVFPSASPAKQARHPKERASVAARWPVFPARRGGFAPAAAAAARASGGSHAAPPA
jgi:two-component system cell cycle sensor histidine kinase PleC